MKYDKLVMISTIIIKNMYGQLMLPVVSDDDIVTA